MMFCVTQTPLKMDGNRRILALGTDTRPGLCWVGKKTLFHLSLRREAEDIEEFYRQAVACVLRKYRVRPTVIAFDPHPLFASRRLALLLQEKFFPSARLKAVYHHWAHVANAVFDARRIRPFIGVAFDGTGFGADGRMWGGEFFYCSAKGFERLAHLAYQPLAGNEAAIRQPWRIAYGILKQAGAGRTPFSGKIPAITLRLVDQMMAQGFQTPLSSSAGRLFDAAAALLGLATTVGKQAQAAQALEAAAASCVEDVPGYAIPVVQGDDGCLVLDTGRLFIAMQRDLARRIKRNVIAMKFHHALAEGIFLVSQHLSRRCSVSCVYVSGGVFLNRILTQKVRSLFERSRLRLVVPPSELMTDDAIARGQVGYCLMRQLAI
jgi:hydrogenase maturation protein HypF